MSIRFKCPNGHALTANEEQAGKVVRCPKCRGRAQVPAGADDGESGGQYSVTQRTAQAPNPNVWIKKVERKQGRDLKLARVRLGLQFHYFRLMVFLMTPAVVILGPAAVAVIAGGTGSRVAGAAAAGAFVLVMILLLILLMLSPILGMIGSILCAKVPRKKGQTRILISFGLDLAAFGLGIVRGVLQLTRVLSAQENFVISMLLDVVQMSLMVASWVFFMQFLRILGEYLEEWGQANDAHSLILFGAVLVVLPAVVLGGVLGLVAQLSPEHLGHTLGVMLLLGIAWLVFLFKFLMAVLQIVGYLREAIAKDLAGR
jgi:hypothetical protein